MLIRKAFDAVPAGGALVVYETIIDDDRSKNAFGLLMSLNMLIETPGASIIPALTARPGWRKLDSPQRASSRLSGRSQW